MVQTKDIKNFELHNSEFSRRQWRRITKILGLDKDEQKRTLWLNIEVGEVVMRPPKES